MVLRRGKDSRSKAFSTLRKDHGNRWARSQPIPDFVHKTQKYRQLGRSRDDRFRFELTKCDTLCHLQGGDWVKVTKSVTTQRLLDRRFATVRYALEND